MNQILSVENNNGNNNYNKYGSGNKIDIKAIVIFFCIILIAFGIFIIINGVYSIREEAKIGNNNNIETGKTPTTPEIEVQIVSESEIKLIISHDKEIASLEYNWNGEDTVQISGNGRPNMEIDMEVPPGANTLNVKVFDINGEKKEYSKEYTSPERPLIKLSQEANAIKVVIESSKIIDYVEYYWDDEEPKKYTINGEKTSTTLEVKEAGEHELNIKAVDKEGNEATKSKKIKVVKVPEVKVTVDSENFIIRASDEDEISKIVINMNGEETEEEVNSKTYETKVKLADGENRIIVTVYNKSGITKQSRVKWTKE